MLRLGASPLDQVAGKEDIRPPRVIRRLLREMEPMEGLGVDGRDLL